MVLSIASLAVVLGFGAPLYPAPRADSTAILVGRIVDAGDSAGIAHANVQITGTELLARTDGRGEFRLRGVPAGVREIEVRAFRYSPHKQSAVFKSGDSLRIEVDLQRLPELLSRMLIQGRSLRVPHGFEDIYERGARGWGTLITREQIDSVNPRDLKTMIGVIPGVFVNERGVYFNHCYGGPGFGEERGELWIDGDRVTKFTRPFAMDAANKTDYFGMNEYLTSILPAEVQAIEVYTSAGRIPAEFASGGSPCAVIAIWRTHGP